MSDPIVIWERSLPVWPAIAAAVIFLTIGFVCALKPHALQREGVRLYRPPFSERRDWRAPFFESPVYILMLRLIGGVSLLVGLGLAGILIASALVPGFAEFR
jgi:hypothetical protein